jgi:Cellulose binding domain/Cellulase (glycosyl hydrolase family 5)
MDAMSISRPWLRRLALFGLVLALVLGYFAVQAGVTHPAKAATNQFHGVNWADPNDNFGTGNLVPVGLSTSDSYATTYAKATAILKGFQALGANTVRMPFNAATVSGSWWGSYTAAWDAASALGMNVVVAPWLQNGTVSDTTSFYNMWDTVINKYGGNSHFYFDIMNEPWAMTATQITNLAATWLARYPNVPRSRVMVPGLYSDIDLCSIGSDSRLNGTLLSIHMYTLGGETHPTEAGWITSFEGRLCGYASRAVLTEFGVPMNTGVNYDGPRDGTNDVSYLYALTDTVRSLGMGSILWTGVKQATQTEGPGPCENASCAITSLNGSGTNLSLSVTNQSGLDRLQYGWGGGGGTTPTPTPSPTNTPTPTPSPTKPTPTPTITAGSSCKVNYVIQNQWPGGFTNSTTITNTGSTGINSWSLQFTFPAGQQVTEGWNGTFSQQGSQVTVTNMSYNGSIPAGTSLSVGFNGTWTSSNPNPTSFTLNGTTCSTS